MKNLEEFIVDVISKGAKTILILTFDERDRAPVVPDAIEHHTDVVLVVDNGTFTVRKNRFERG